MYKNVIFAVPCGNFGNLTAGLFASRMGLPVRGFLAAVNINDIFGEYLSSGTYRPRTARRTLSNAMDVGDPGNIERIRGLYQDDVGRMRRDISSVSISDDQTRNGIAELFETFGYIIDPHGAVAYQAVRSFAENISDPVHYLILETAHPAKFKDIVEDILGKKIDVPDRLQISLKKSKQATQLPADMRSLKDVLLSSR